MFYNRNDLINGKYSYIKKYSHISISNQTSADKDFVFKYQLLVCQSQYQLHFTGTLLALQGILLIFGTFLAWETKKVTYQPQTRSMYELNTKYELVVVNLILMV